MLDEGGMVRVHEQKSNCRSNNIKIDKNTCNFLSVE